jgi:hypothetical protein
MSFSAGVNPRARCCDGMRHTGVAKTRLVDPPAKESSDRCTPTILNPNTCSHR